MPAQSSISNLFQTDHVSSNARLNANRMLRCKKIVAYVTDRIDPDGNLDDQPLKPEEYVDLYCHDQIVPHDMTLATLKAHVWKTGGDVILHYKSNGRKPRLEEDFAREKERIAGPMEGKSSEQGEMASQGQDQ